MLNVVSERAPLVSECLLSDLLIILQVQGVPDVFTYPSLETSEYRIVLSCKIIVGFPSADIRYCVAYYVRRVYGGRLSWLDMVDVRFSCVPRWTYYDGKQPKLAGPIVVHITIECHFSCL